MALVIAYASNVRMAERQINNEWDADSPDDAAFFFPDESKKGDRVAYFIGGKVDAFVGTDLVLTNWRKAGSGSWKGEYYINAKGATVLLPRRPADEVMLACNVNRPTGPSVVAKRDEAALWAFLNGREISKVDRAIEGTRTESRSRRRSKRLRDEALRHANGVCSACQVDFKTVAGELGTRALVVHHTEQIRDYDEPRWTSVDQLAVVCANCHMMIHSDPQRALSVHDLRQALDFPPSKASQPRR